MCRWAECTAEQCLASIFLTSPAEKVTVVMELAKSTHEIIKHDSVASIETEGMLGNQYVAISFGSAGQAEVKDGEIIQSVPPLVLAEMLAKTNAILDSSQQAIQIRNVGHGPSEVDKRQDRFRTGNRGSAGERQASL